MDGAPGDVHRLSRSEREPVLSPNDDRLPVDYIPVLRSVAMALEAQLLSRIDDDSLHFMIRFMSKHPK
jgi:hypothetical protein